ncbi:MAG: GDCCVxC domain-containing (seleno)protein [Candidatus Micrarchaeia archaeon]
MRAKLKCPVCGGLTELEVPGDRCIPFYNCAVCKKFIRAPRESCCVVCSYGDVRCPVSHVR